ncbi:PEP-CTERM sorting domain-containing protein [Duganella radicis]|uniref:PEP-CTERM sorting domain-containing protein n=1 Tax=Duganella radicis TaxID=551988 RepID=A0A6L6PCS5_9BURK|nr:PEP-CTERM sorting domain-containing protein [Duganella radicis]MTV36175.1 PEP-CTERM sorting domain-containing protein [Duganella radicis]
MKHTIVAAALALASLSAAHADTITGLYNTGLGQSGSADAHYSLSSAVSSTPIITYDSVWPVDGTWLNNTGVSRWITPTASQAASLDAAADGIYTYSLSFDLSGYNAASAVFAGRVAADNAVAVKLNGAEIGSAVGFQSWYDFGANSGFVAGVNTLEFVVTNYRLGAGNPTGLRVEFDSSSVTAVPEPETYAMLLGGLALVGAVARRRKQK